LSESGYFFHLFELITRRKTFVVMIYSIFWAKNVVHIYLLRHEIPTPKNKVEATFFDHQTQFE